MADAREANARRLRRLTAMDKERAVERASTALQRLWTAGSRPDDIVLRVELIQLPGDTTDRAPLVRLVLPRGVALRFYLLALFEAQCRLGPGEEWANERPLQGVGSWADLIAIDGAYDAGTQTYMQDTKQGRQAGDLRLRQIKSAMDTLENLGPEQALVTVPRAKNGGRRLYPQFSLMKETGRGGLQTPDVYTVPRWTWNAQTFTVPASFFLNGWVQVLSPSEVATWLILRALSQWARDQHAKTGVYLFGNARLEDFGLRRDAWEDGCQRLRQFGLIRHATSSRPLDAAPEGPFAHMGDLFAIWGRERYKPYHWQVTDVGLAQNAMKVCTRELTLRQKKLDDGAKLRSAKRRTDPAQAEPEQQP